MEKVSGSDLTSQYRRRYVISYSLEASRTLRFSPGSVCYRPVIPHPRQARQSRAGEMRGPHGTDAILVWNLQARQVRAVSAQLGLAAHEPENGIVVTAHDAATASLGENRLDRRAHPLVHDLKSCDRSSTARQLGGLACDAAAERCKVRCDRRLGRRLAPARNIAADGGLVILFKEPDNVRGGPLSAGLGAEARLHWRQWESVQSGPEGCSGNETMGGTARSPKGGDADRRALTDHL